jgi:mannose/fructose/N-acetylgalactosamine-specific phosphotransferase system component IID
MTSLRRSDLTRVAWRSMLLQATFNYERQQGIGWAWALQPAIERLVPPGKERRERLAEHTAYFNTQPTLASLALGAVAGLEEERARGAADAGTVARVKSALGAALGALGDRLFWFTLRPLAACLGVVFALSGSAYGAVALWAGYNAVHLTLRLAGVGIGHAEGPALLSGTLRGRLESLVRRLSLIGCVVVGVVVAALLAPHGDPASLATEATLVGGLLFGMLAALRSRPSPTQWGLGLGVLCLLAGFAR